MNDDAITGYRYIHAELNQSNDVLLPTVLKHLDDLHFPVEEKRLFELGCGNGRSAVDLSGVEITEWLDLRGPCKP